VADVDTTDHGENVDIVGLHQPPGRDVVDHTHDLRHDFADDRGDAFGVGECLVQDALPRNTEFGNYEALSEFAEVRVILLAAARWEDKHEKFGIVVVAHVLELLLCVARALLHHGLVDICRCALEGGLELIDEGVFDAYAFVVILEREDGPTEVGWRGVDATL
jgi:hypothetical protein